MKKTFGDNVSEAKRIFNILTKGLVSERENIHRRLSSGDKTIDTVILRDLALEALKGPYDVATSSRDSHSPRAWARCWLLSTLGRIYGDNREASDYVAAHTKTANEPNEWARYWAFESLYVSKYPNLKEIAIDMEGEKENLSSCLALIYLASIDHADSLTKVLNGIHDRKWWILRGLRIIPIVETVEPLCSILESDIDPDLKYDAIIALGIVPPEGQEAETAVSALLNNVKRCRKHKYWDSMRSKSIVALNNFRSPESVPLLVEELADANPSIVLEAARALESITGVAKATRQVVEAASIAGDESVTHYSNALRWMNRDKVAEELESVMMTGTLEQQDMARKLMSEVGGRAAFEKLRARSETMKQHLDALEKTEEGIRELFDSSLIEAKSGYRLGTWMDIIVFFLGVGLVILSGTLVINGKETIAGITGAGGVLAVLYNLFISNPRRKVQESVEHLMALKVIFLGYLRQLHQADKAYVRRFLDDTPLTPAEVREFAGIVSDAMKDSISHIERYKNTAPPKD